MNAVTRHELAQLESPLVSFKLDGREVTGRADETIIQIADREGIDIPRLCYKDGLDAVGTDMWRALTTMGSVQEAYEHLLAEYDVEPETLRRDMEQLVEKLEASGLVKVEA